MLLRLLVEISKEQKEKVDITTAIKLLSDKNKTRIKTINNKDSVKSG